MAPGAAPQTKTIAGIMRLLWYPSQDGPVDEKLMGIGSHTDCESHLRPRLILGA